MEKKESSIFLDCPMRTVPWNTNYKVYLLKRKTKPDQALDLPTYLPEI